MKSVVTNLAFILAWILAPFPVLAAPSVFNPLTVYEEVASSRNQEETALHDSHPPFVNFFDAVCTLTAPVDRTGAVNPFVLFALDRGTYEAKDQFINELREQWSSMDEKSRPSFSRYGVKTYIKYYLIKERLDRFAAILEKVKGDVIAFFREKAPESEIPALVESRLKTLKINAPFGQDPQRLFSPILMVGETSVSVGGLFLENVESESAIYFSLAHEMGHYLVSETDELFPSVKQCIAASWIDSTVKASLVPHRQEEIQADLFAHEILSRYLHRLESSPPEKFELLRNSVRLLCGSSGSLLGHPAGQFRIEQIEQNPIFRDILPNEIKGPADAHFCSFKK